MASFFPCKAVIVFAFLIVSLSTSSAQLSSNVTEIYPHCPNISQIVRKVVQDAITNERRMGASLLRLHFHDCFVKGCDASILLDSKNALETEKTAPANSNSVRGFEVIEKIKKALEKECPGNVSCADILAISARDAIDILSRHKACYNVEVGRRDSTTANQTEVTQNIPSPQFNISGLIQNFAEHKLNISDLVVLSGAHTIGDAKCSVLRPTLYNKNSTLDKKFAEELMKNCKEQSGPTDNRTFPLDTKTSTVFDNKYFHDVIDNKTLLQSDGELLNNQDTKSLVHIYSENQKQFFLDFAKAMVKMGRLGVLPENKGEIRKSCSRIN